MLTGVLATVAVLMTRNPDAPPLSTVAVRRLQTPMHFAPVKAVKQAPCPGAEAVLDEAGTTCYQVEPGVTVTTVQKIETLRERNGSYSVRIVLSPQNRGPISDLTRDTVERQLAVIVGDKVVTAPRVTQAIIQDSLSIAGFTKEGADALVARLVGAPGAPPATGPSTVPNTTRSSAGTDAGTAPGTSPAATASTSAGSGATQGTRGGNPASGTGNTGGAGGTGGTGGTGGAGGTGGTGGTRGTGAAAAGGSPRFDSCRQAVANGYGPYTRGWHPEYDWYADGDIDHDGVACDPQDLAA
ncbi:excalibur calcium-binding domain-containing protein [Thermopolyspora sp. NPDC052614]|uniref:excalibur calcium-binding domain-containing protein n=1 Tax=Thermopolyspora sp. NPDC052614 TaxID=3155682 RepID=UPI0034246C70